MLDYRLILFFFFTLFTSLWGGDDQTTPLLIGMELSYPPFETIDREGKPYGVSVDLAYALGRDLNRKVEILNIPFIGLIPALNTNKIDLIISSLTKTKERESAIDFSNPYLITGLTLLVSVKSNLQGIDQAKEPGRRIVVKAGTSGQAYALKNLPPENVIVLDKEASAVLEVVQGKADAFIYDQLSVYTNWQKNSKTTRAILNPFEKEYWAIGVRKGDSELLEQVNRFLEKFRKDKGMEKLGEKYFPHQLEAFKKMQIPFIL